MGRMTKKIKDHAEELYNSDAYQEARDEEFNDQFKDFLLNDIFKKAIMTEDDIQGFLDSFTFQDENDWCMNEAESAYDDYADAQYEQMKDDR